MNPIVVFATETHLQYATSISELIAAAANAKDSGLAHRSPEHISTKIEEGKGVIAFINDVLAGFCYIEAWEEERFVSHSGLIVDPQFRGTGLAKLLKEKAFELTIKKYPNALMFGLTTSESVMKINAELGYIPVGYSKIVQDDKFWKGCKTCSNFNILMSKERKICLCTAMVWKPK